MHVGNIKIFRANWAKYSQRVRKLCVSLLFVSKVIYFIKKNTAIYSGPGSSVSQSILAAITQRLGLGTLSTTEIYVPQSGGWQV